jgi:hypothetical protein
MMVTLEKEDANADIHQQRFVIMLNRQNLYSDRLRLGLKIKCFTKLFFLIAKIHKFGSQGSIQIPQ